MKRIIFLVFLIFGVCFSQTGMKADKGESGFGVWIEASRLADCEYCDQSTTVSLDYMFKFGLEIGIEAGVLKDVDDVDADIEYDIEGTSLAYHIKSNDGGNFSLGVSQREVLYEEFDYSLDISEAYLSFYGKNKSFFTISQQTIDVDAFELETEFISFGGIINFGKGGLLIGYKLNADDVEEAFEEEDFDLLKNGLLTLSLGGVF